MYTILSKPKNITRVGGVAPWVRIVRESPPMAYIVADPEIIHGPGDVAAIMRPKLSQEETESFNMLILNSQHKVTYKVEISRGILNSSLVHPREVFRVAIAFNAYAVIFAHNHPSGDPTPSADDREVTRRLVESGELLDIRVVDHVIIGGDKYVSLSEYGMM